MTDSATAPIPHGPHRPSGAPGGAPLRAPAPGWTLDADVVVVGSGIAGLTAALRCAAAGRHTVVVTKARLDDGSTRWAQGGIAAALGDGDSPEQHCADTLVAGAGLCDEAAVDTLVREGPGAVRRLVAAGARFDTDPGTGEVALTREGGHHRRRIAHAGGDATGAEVSRALLTAVRALAPDGATPNSPCGHGSSAPRTGTSGPRTATETVTPGTVRTVENALVLDLLKTPDGAAAGVTLHVMGEGQHDGVGAVRAPAVVLATGGMGQVFAATTNPAVSTGDGVALALRAGAEVSDLEFVQFHPTVLYLGPDAAGQQPLISEAVRGEGAHLVDAAGVRFMTGQHELAELAPRDVVAKAITRRAAEQGTAHMYLDARHFGAAMWESRFPTILAACRAHGIDPVTEPVPVAPAAHYASGGVRTDRRGRTTVPGLYACGEAACTGVHGANRLASNSLLEGLVFAERLADDIAAHVPAAPVPPPYVAPAYGPDRPPSPPLPPEARPVIQRIMTRCAGVLRSEASLTEAAALLDELYAAAADPAGTADPAGQTNTGGPANPPGTEASWADATAPDARTGDPAAHSTGRTAPGPARKPAEPGVESWETANLHLVARVLVAAALRRAETRGCHWREDRPHRDDARWRRHLVVTLDGGPRNLEGAAAAAPAPVPRAARLDVRTTDATAFPSVSPTAFGVGGTPTKELP